MDGVAEPPATINDVDDTDAGKDEWTILDVVVCCLHVVAINDDVVSENGVSMIASSRWLQVGIWQNEWFINKANFGMFIKNYRQPQRQALRLRESKILLFRVVTFINKIQINVIRLQRKSDVCLKSFEII